MKDIKFLLPFEGSVIKSFTTTENEEGDWIFEGIASTGSVDLFGDVVRPASFFKTIEFFKQNGKIFYDHLYAKEDEMIEAKTPIGVPIDVQVREDGLWIKAVLNKRHPLAQKFWHENLTNPDQRFAKSMGLSIGAKALGPVKQEYSPTHGKFVKVLPELVLYEVSVTPKPVNPETSTWASVVKSLLEDSSDTSEQKVLDNLIPTEVLFDSNNQQFVVKSESDDASVSQIISLEEIIKAMPDFLDKDKDKEKDPNKKPEDTENKDKPEGEDTGAPDANDGQDGAPQPDEGAGLDGLDAPNPDEDPSANPDDPNAGGGGLDAMLGGGGPEAGGPAAGPAAPGGDPTDPNADPGVDMGSMNDLGSDSNENVQALILDKLEVLVDSMAVMIENQAKNQNAQQGFDTSTTPPQPNQGSMDISKSLQDNNTILIDTIKSVVTSTLEAVLPAMITNLINQSNMVQKNVDGQQLTPAEPPVVLSAPLYYTTETGEKVVLKNVESLEPQVAVSNAGQNTTVLKSMVELFNNTLGHGDHIIQKRNDIARRAERELGIRAQDFVNLADDVRRGRRFI